MSGASRLQLILGVAIMTWGVAGGAVAEGEASPAIDPQVRETIERMGDYLDSLGGFRIVAEVISDEIDPETGSREQFGAEIDIRLRRPDRFRATHRTALDRQEMYYDGAKFSLHDVEKKVYGSLPITGVLEVALKQANEAAGIVPPLADLLYRSPHVALMEHAEAGVYLGLDLVGGVTCDHLAFREADVDWQVWIETGDRPVPRKLVITTKNVEGWPQFGALIRSFEADPEFPEELFHFSPPEGAERIEFLPLEGEASP